MEDHLAGDDFHTKSDSEDSEQLGPSQVDEENLAAPISTDMSSDLRALFKEDAESQLQNNINSSASLSETATPSSPLSLQPINVLYPNMQTKEVNIGGKLIEWTEVTNFLKDMKLELVPKANRSPQRSKTDFVQKKRMPRELHNLQFGINYDKQVRAKGSNNIQ